MHLFLKANYFISDLFFAFVFFEITNKCLDYLGFVLLLFALEEYGYQSTDQM